MQLAIGRDVIARLVVRTLLLHVAIGAVLFVAGGDWQWPQAWLFLIEFLVAAFAISFWLARHDPALLEQRLTLLRRADQKAWDRILISALVIAFFGWLALIALDARRFGWSHVPIALQVLGAFGIALCMIVTWQTFRFNSFAVPQARIQAERAQHVISDGPYKYIRHPMYAGTLPFFIGVPLMLGSFWGLAVTPLFVIALAVRAVGEERMLRRELAGYDDYTRKVRFRLVPGLW